jgi:hypothetical protein
MNYRIKEQFGIFFVEKEFEKQIETKSVLSSMFPKIFKPKITIEKGWSEISETGTYSHLMNPSMKFETKERALKAIENLTPRYHDVVQDNLMLSAGSNELNQNRS